MENKDPIKISSIVITFVIFLAGSVLSFWIYTTIIEKPITTEDTSRSNIEINSETLKKIETVAVPSIPNPADGFGRPNPFLPYK